MYSLLSALGMSGTFLDSLLLGLLGSVIDSLLSTLVRLVSALVGTLESQSLLLGAGLKVDLQNKGRHYAISVCKNSATYHLSLALLASWHCKLLCLTN